MRAYELMTDNPELSHDDQSFRLIEAVCKRYKTHRNMGEIDRDFINGAEHHMPRPGAAKAKRWKIQTFSQKTCRKVIFFCWTIIFGNYLYSSLFSFSFSIQRSALLLKTHCSCGETSYWALIPFLSATSLYSIWHFPWHADRMNKIIRAP